MKPFVIQCCDYHDFDLVKIGVDYAINKKSRFKEITLLLDGDDEGEYDPYWAIFYVGKCPIKENEIEFSELKKLGIDIHEEV